MRPFASRKCRRGPSFGSGPFAALRCALLSALLLAAPLATAHAQGGLTAIEAEVEQISSRARPSMVTVIAQREVAASRNGGIVTPKRTHNRVGSGVAVESDLVLTTSSVVLGAQKVMVVTDNGLQVEAEVAGMDPVFNLALLRVSGLRLSPIRFASRAPQLGDYAIVLGSSYGGAPTQSVGNIAYRFREPRTSLLQLTNEVYPGNSGGAALNTRGELIGLVQGELGAPEAPGRNKDDAERRPSGMSFVIPAEDIAPVFDGFKREGRIRHGFFGVSTRNTFVESSTDAGQRVPTGAAVEAVAPGGPAARLGLQKGDLIVAFDGERVLYSEQLARWVAATKPGTVVRIVWAHQDEERSGRVALGESPSVIPDWMKPEPLAASGSAASRLADADAKSRRSTRDRTHAGADTVR